MDPLLLWLVLGGTAAGLVVAGVAGVLTQSGRRAFRWGALLGIGAWICWSIWTSATACDDDSGECIPLLASVLGLFSLAGWVGGAALAALVIAAWQRGATSGDGASAR